MNLGSYERQLQQCAGGNFPKIALCRQSLRFLTNGIYVPLSNFTTDCFNHSPRLTSHAFKKNANVACVQNRAYYLHNAVLILVAKAVENVVVIKIQQILVA